MIQIKAGRDINNAPGGNIHTKTVVEKPQESVFTKIVKWITTNIIVFLVVTVVGGLIVAYVVFRMHWQ